MGMMLGGFGDGVADLLRGGVGRGPDDVVEAVGNDGERGGFDVGMATAVGGDGIAGDARGMDGAGRVDDGVLRADGLGADWIHAQEGDGDALGEPSAGAADDDLIDGLAEAGGGDVDHGELGRAEVGGGDHCAAGECLDRA